MIKGKINKSHTRRITRIKTGFSHKKIDTNKKKHK